MHYGWREESRYVKIGEPEGRLVGKSASYSELVKNGTLHGGRGLCSGIQQDMTSTIRILGNEAFINK